MTKTMYGRKINCFDCDHGNVGGVPTPNHTDHKYQAKQDHPYWDPDFWIPRRPLAPDRIYHFNVIYNVAKSPLAYTKDCDLALCVTKALVGRLEMRGYVNSYFHDRDRRHENTMKAELERVITGSSVTIILLTPGFLHNCLDRYFNLAAFRLLLSQPSPNDQLITLSVGVSSKDVPAHLHPEHVLYFHKDWEVDLPNWNRFDTIVLGILRDHRCWMICSEDASQIHQLTGKPYGALTDDEMLRVKSQKQKMSLDNDKELSTKNGVEQTISVKCNSPPNMYYTRGRSSTKLDTFVFREEDCNRVRHSSPADNFTKLEYHFPPKSSNSLTSAPSLTTTSDFECLDSLSNTRQLLKKWPSEILLVNKHSEKLSQNEDDRWEHWATKAKQDCPRDLFVIPTSGSYVRKSPQPCLSWNESYFSKSRENLARAPSHWLTSLQNDGAELMACEANLYCASKQTDHSCGMSAFQFYGKNSRDKQSLNQALVSSSNRLYDILTSDEMDSTNPVSVSRDYMVQSESGRGEVSGKNVQALFRTHAYKNTHHMHDSEEIYGTALDNYTKSALFGQSNNRTSNVTSGVSSFFGETKKRALPYMDKVTSENSNNAQKTFVPDAHLAANMAQRTPIDFNSSFEKMGLSDKVWDNTYITMSYAEKDQFLYDILDTACASEKSYDVCHLSDSDIYWTSDSTDIQWTCEDMADARSSEGTRVAVTVGEARSISNMENEDGSLDTRRLSNGSEDKHIRLLSSVMNPAKLDKLDDDMRESSSEIEFAGDSLTDTEKPENKVFVDVDDKMISETTDKCPLNTTDCKQTLVAQRNSIATLTLGHVKRINQNQATDSLVVKSINAIDERNRSAINHNVTIASPEHKPVSVHHVCPTYRTVTNSATDFQGHLEGSITISDKDACVIERDDEERLKIATTKETCQFLAHKVREKEDTLGVQETETHCSKAQLSHQSLHVDHNGAGQQSVHSVIPSELPKALGSNAEENIPLPNKISVTSSLITSDYSRTRGLQADKEIQSEVVAKDKSSGEFLVRDDLHACGQTQKNTPTDLAVPSVPDSTSLVATTELVKAHKVQKIPSVDLTSEYSDDKCNSGDATSNRKHVSEVALENSCPSNEGKCMLQVTDTGVSKNAPHREDNIEAYSGHVINFHTRTLSKQSADKEITETTPAGSGLIELSGLTEKFTSQDEGRNSETYSGFRKKTLDEQDANDAKLPLSDNQTRCYEAGYRTDLIAQLELVSCLKECALETPETPITDKTGEENKRQDKNEDSDQSAECSREKKGHLNSTSKMSDTTTEDKMFQTMRKTEAELNKSDKNSLVKNASKASPGGVALCSELNESIREETESSYGEQDILESARSCDIMQKKGNVCAKQWPQKLQNKEMPQTAEDLRLADEGLYVDHVAYTISKQDMNTPLKSNQIHSETNDQALGAQTYDYENNVYGRNINENGNCVHLQSSIVSMTIACEVNMNKESQLATSDSTDKHNNDPVVPGFLSSDVDTRQSQTLDAGRSFHAQGHDRNIDYLHSEDNIENAFARAGLPYSVQTHLRTLELPDQNTVENFVANGIAKQLLSHLKRGKLNADLDIRVSSTEGLSDVSKILKDLTSDKSSHESIESMTSAVKSVKNERNTHSTFNAASSLSRSEKYDNRTPFMQILTTDMTTDTWQESDNIVAYNLASEMSLWSRKVTMTPQQTLESPSHLTEQREQAVNLTAHGSVSGSEVTEKATYHMVVRSAQEEMSHQMAEDFADAAVDTSGTNRNNPSTIDLFSKSHILIDECADIVSFSGPGVAAHVENTQANSQLFVLPNNEAPSLLLSEDFRYDHSDNEVIFDDSGAHNKLCINPRNGTLYKNNSECLGQMLESLSPVEKHAVNLSYQDSETVNQCFSSEQRHSLQEKGVSKSISLNERGLETVRQSIVCADNLNLPANLESCDDNCENSTNPVNVYSFFRKETFLRVSDAASNSQQAGFSSPLNMPAKQIFFPGEEKESSSSTKLMYSKFRFDNLEENLIYCEDLTHGRQEESPAPDFPLRQMHIAGTTNEHETRDLTDQEMPGTCHTSLIATGSEVDVQCRQQTELWQDPIQETRTANTDTTNEYRMKRLMSQEEQMTVIGPQISSIASLTEVLPEQKVHEQTIGARVSDTLDPRGARSSPTEASESLQQVDWLLEVYKGTCHSLSRPDMPYLG